MTDKIVEMNGRLHTKTHTNSCTGNKKSRKMELGEDFCLIKVSFIVILTWLLFILFHCRWVKEL